MPYMPIAHVNERTAPPAMKGARSGRPTRRQNCQRVADATWAASDHSSRTMPIAGSSSSTKSGTLAYS